MAARYLAYGTRVPSSIQRRGYQRSPSALIVEVNPQENELTPFAGISLRGKAGEVLPYLAARIMQAAV